MTTITGFHGQTQVGEVTFTPTSRDGDGSAHDATNGVFIGTVYVDKRYPYDSVTDKSTEVITFVALDPETYEDVGRFDTQHDALTHLLRLSRTHPFAPENDDPRSVCGDCDKREGEGQHFGPWDLRYWPESEA